MAYAVIEIDYALNTCMKTNNITCCRTCFTTSDAANQKIKFVSQLSKSLGHGGGFTCGFTDRADSLHSVPQKRARK